MRNLDVESIPIRRPFPQSPYCSFYDNLIKLIKDEYLNIFVGDPLSGSSKGRPLVGFSIKLTCITMMEYNIIDGEFIKF